MTKEDDTKYPLPYYARMEVLLKIMDELRGAGDRKEISVIYTNIRGDSASKPFGLRLGRFLGLIDSDNKTASLTDTGYQFSMLSEEKKRMLLAKKLPSHYITLLKWLKGSKDRMMDMDTMKSEILSNFRWKPSPRVFHESLLTFGDVAEYCGYINFVKGSKGSKSRFQLTDNGLQMLSGLPNSDVSVYAEEKKSPEIPPSFSNLSDSAKFPIRIEARGSKFETDVNHESDWFVIEAFIKTLKAKWKDSIVKGDDKEPESTHGESIGDEDGQQP